MNDIMGTSSPLCGIRIGAPLELLMLHMGPMSKRETPMTEETRTDAYLFSRGVAQARLGA
jgi:hypothetical protein